MTKRSKFCLIGIPDDEGVRNVGGRLGASRGPRAFRKSFLNLKSRKPVSEYMKDQKDAPIDPSSIEMTHQNVASAIAQAHEEIPNTLIVGGGHDHGHSHLVGIKNALKGKTKEPRVGCINIDAHLDLRPAVPTITSGSPFYLAMENKTIRGEDLIEFGIQPHCNAAPLWDYAKSHNIEIIQMSELHEPEWIGRFEDSVQKLCNRCDAVVIQLDLDAIAMAHAPGVSAPQPDGFTPNQIHRMMKVASRFEKVVSLGIFELNPEHDRDDATAKAASLAAYYFFLD